MAFIGPNPHHFLLNIPKHYSVDSFTFIEQSQESVEKSYEIISAICESDKLGDKQPENIVPRVMDEETEWDFEEEFDLIVSTMSLHWINDLDSAFRRYLKSLEPDGIFVSASLGGDSLQEMRICMNLAD